MEHRVECMGDLVNWRSRENETIDAFESSPCLSRMLNNLIVIKWLDTNEKVLDIKNRVRKTV